jgi:hypothetical protein
MRRVRNSLGPIIGYHGCECEVAEQVLSNKTQLKLSDNAYDWLGPGIYFWVDSPERGLRWALEQKERKIINDPDVVGAYIHLGLCLNLTDYGVTEEIEYAYDVLKRMAEKSGLPLPKNDLPRDGFYIRRPLDCAVMNTLHRLREQNHEQPYDSVYGVFEEGAPLFPGAGFRKKTHIQVAVLNPKDCIYGYFRVPQVNDEKQK